MRHRLASLLLALVLAAPAAAQAPTPGSVPITPARPDPRDPDAVILEELVVTARDRGPAWWTVSNGTSTVWVLGVPTLAPKHMQWDRAAFERRLAGASAVILPYQDVRVRFATSLGAAWNYLRLRSSMPFEATLDPAARARFAAARARLGQPARRYGTRNPLAAGLLLLTDYRDRNGLTNTDPIKLIKILTRQARVPIRQESYDIAPQLGAIIRTPAADGRACLDEVIAQVEAGPGVTLQAAKAWADGDVRGALGNERTYERCIALVPGAAAFDERTKADEVAEIEAALKAPGHAIAVVRLRPLLSQGGVLDRLRTAGFTVKTPGED
ncbi:MAG TPA: TraB/GumN family protein [Phenylobacterium sp.]|uniref:TraB/GumN family protein n=1 Tax=Phenylobacterium sp. TaxID=1871053 RepID=UPI002BB0D74F|nr:TraB/GumN family protein [Phenylobacterium sp.]HSV03796.1 TraB/GumN family protein [Phenylobacterium sp.]